MADFDPLLAYLDGFPTARWNYPDAPGTPAAVTYSFMQAVPAYEAQANYPGFTPLDASMQAAARSALGSWAEVANLTFTEVADAGPGGEIRIGSFDTRQLPADSSLYGAGGYSYYPTFVGGEPIDPAGDVYLGRYAENAQVAPGEYGLETLTHEIGHAIGLKHPFEGSLTLPAGKQDFRHSIMNYETPEDASVVSVTGTAEDYSWVRTPLYPSGPMLEDIAAVQALYGANMAHAAGDDRYAWAANARFYETIWDAGGTDTIDTSNQVLDSVIDLRAGHFSSIAMRGTEAEKRLEIPAFATEAPTPGYGGHDNLAIAYGAVIENARGGAGDDTITGNAAGNCLTGREGTDRLDGGRGNDALFGGAGADSFVIGNGTGADRIGDFTHGVDHIRLVGFAGLTQFSQLAIQDQAGGAVISLDADDSVTLAGVARSALTAADFVFA